MSSFEKKTRKCHPIFRARRHSPKKPIKTFVARISSITPNVFIQFFLTTLAWSAYLDSIASQNWKQSNSNSISIISEHFMHNYTIDLLSTLATLLRTVQELQLKCLFPFDVSSKLYIPLLILSCVEQGLSV